MYIYTYIDKKPHGIFAGLRLCACPLCGFLYLKNNLTPYKYELSSTETSIERTKKKVQHQPDSNAAAAAIRSSSSDQSGDWCRNGGLDRTCREEGADIGGGIARSGLESTNKRKSSSSVLLDVTLAGTLLPDANEAVLAESERCRVAATVA